MARYSAGSSAIKLNLNSIKGSNANTTTHTVDTIPGFNSTGLIGSNTGYTGTGGVTNIGATGGTIITGGTGYHYGTNGADNIVAKAGTYYANTYGGNDYFDASKSNGGEVDLGAGNDTFIGSKGTDYVNGGAGNDMIYGGAGSDVLQGGFGSDKIYGGAGNDYISGLDREGYFVNNGAGNDAALLNQKEAADSLYGGDGNDKIVLSAKDTDVWGGTGADTFEIFATQSKDNAHLFQGGGIQDFKHGEDKLHIDGASKGGILNVQGNHVVYIDAEGDRYNFDVQTDQNGALSLDDFIF